MLVDSLGFYGLKFRARVGSLTPRWFQQSFTMLQQRGRGPDPESSPIHFMSFHQFGTIKGWLTANTSMFLLVKKLMKFRRSAVKKLILFVEDFEGLKSSPGTFSADLFQPWCVIAGIGGGREGATRFIPRVEESQRWWAIPLSYHSRRLSIALRLDWRTLTSVWRCTKAVVHLCQHWCFIFFVVSARLLERWAYWYVTMLIWCSAMCNG